MNKYQIIMKRKPKQIDDNPIMDSMEELARWILKNGIIGVEDIRHQNIGDKGGQEQLKGPEMLKLWKLVDNKGVPLPPTVKPLFG